MPRVKVIMVTYLSALALGALVSASASAATAGWMINGSPLTTSKALMAKSISTTGTLAFAGELLKCNAAFIEGSPVISAPNKGTAPSITLNECESTGDPTCTLESSKITSLPLKVTEITLDGALAIQGKIQPVSKSVLATIAYKGQECAFLGVQSINGSLKALASSGQDEDILQAVLVNDNSELKVGSSIAHVHFTVTLSPLALESWSFL